MHIGVFRKVSIGLAVTLLALQSKSYRALSQIYQQAPEAELLEASA